MLNAVINRATSGDGTALQAGVANASIHVFSYAFQAGGTVNVTWKHGDDTTTVALSGAMPNVANSGVSANGGMNPLFILPKGKGLYLNLSGAVQVSGHVAYAVK